MTSAAQLGFLDGYLYKAALLAAPESLSAVPEVKGYGFDSDLDTEQIGPRKFKMRKPLRYTSSTGEIIDIPAGFVTDYYTLPEISDRVLPGISQELNKDPRPAVLHDYLYHTGMINGKRIKKMQADALLYDAMSSQKLEDKLKNIVRFGVQMGGSPAWYAYRARDLGYRANNSIWQNLWR